MAHVRLHDLTPEQVSAFINWFRDAGEEGFRTYCVSNGIDPVPHVDCEHAPNKGDPDYDGSMEIEMYSLRQSYWEDRNKRKKDAEASSLTSPLAPP